MRNLKKLEENVVFTLRELYHRFGYAQFKMSKFEAYDLYMQNKEFLVSDGVITFTDTDGTLMALKPDVTLSIVKNFGNDSSAVQKVCYSENVYRISGTSRSYREIMQTGLECLGHVGLYEICEVLVLAAKSLAAISEDYVLDVSNMGIVSGVLNKLQLSEQEIAEVLRCLGEKNIDALLAVLDGRPADELLALMEMSGTITSSLPALEKIADQEAVNELRCLCQVFEKHNLAQNIHLDFSIISDRNYYNNYVFRGYVKGIPSAVLAGGQYDRLMEKMNKQAGGIGFAVYLDQLELLDPDTADYDIDTILLYDDNADVLTLSELAEQFSKDGILLAKNLPAGKRYRRLLKLHNGRVITVEENG